MTKNGAANTVRIVRHLHELSLSKPCQPHSLSISNAGPRESMILDIELTFCDTPSNHLFLSSLMKPITVWSLVCTTRAIHLWATMSLYPNTMDSGGCTTMRAAKNVTPLRPSCSTMVTLCRTYVSTNSLERLL